MGPGSHDGLDAWERRYREGGRRATRPSRFVTDAVTSLGVEPGRALDVAGGTGRHAVWLATRGWSVTLVDGAPTAIDLAVEDATAAGVEITVALLDLETAPPPAGPWDLILVHHYLHRGLLRSADTLLAPGGHLVWAQPTVLDPHRRPGRAYRVEIGEAPTLLPSSLEVLSLVEGETEGRHEAMVVARRPP